MRGPVRAYAGRGQSGGRLVSRYRRDWDEDGKANSRDSAAGKPGSATSTREDANWKRCAASVDTIFFNIIRGGGTWRNPLRPLVTAGCQRSLSNRICGWIV